MTQLVTIIFWFSLVIGIAHPTPGATPPAFSEGSSSQTNERVTPFPPTHPGSDVCGLTKPSGTDSEIGLNSPLAHDNSDVFNNSKLDLQKLTPQLERG